MNRISRFAATLAVLALSAPLASAQSEGIAHMKGAVRGERGESISMEGKVYVSRAAARSEWTMDLSQIAGRKDRPEKGMPASHIEVMLWKASEPGVTTMLNVERKTYSVIRAESSETAQKSPQAEYTVTRLGKDTVAGFSCERALLKRTGSRDETEVCVSKELGGSGAWLDAMNRRQKTGSLFQALTGSGLTGFPLRWAFRHSGEKEAQFSFELTRFEKTSLPASTFEIPAGYKKVSAGEVRMTPEQEEAMKKAMENMTPEQRKQFEEMMKKQKGDQ